jgi:hypothetical protein
MPEENGSGINNIMSIKLYTRISRSAGESVFAWVSRTARETIFARSAVVARRTRRSKWSWRSRNFAWGTRISILARCSAIARSSSVSFRSRSARISIGARFAGRPLRSNRSNGTNRAGTAIVS